MIPSAVARWSMYTPPDIRVAITYSSAWAVEGMEKVCTIQRSTGTLIAGTHIIGQEKKTRFDDER